MGVCNLDFRDPCFFYMGKVVETWCATLWRGTLSQGLLGDVFSAAKVDLQPADSFKKVIFSMLVSG